MGWDETNINIMEVAERLQDVGIQALTIHGRTRAQMYKGEANWSWIEKVKNNQRIQIPIFGNGDIDSPEKALIYKNTYGVDGIMIGRAAIGYPWIFNEIKHYFKTGEILNQPTIQERVKVCKKHLLKSVEWKTERPGLLEMRPHYSQYFKGLDHFKEFRTQLVSSLDLNEILEILNQIELHYLAIEQLAI